MVEEVVVRKKRDNLNQRYSFKTDFREAVADGGGGGKSLMFGAFSKMDRLPLEMILLA